MCFNSGGDNRSPAPPPPQALPTPPAPPPPPKPAPAPEPLKAPTSKPKLAIGGKRSRDSSSSRRGANSVRQIPSSVNTGSTSGGVNL